MDKHLKNIAQEVYTITSDYSFKNYNYGLLSGKMGEILFLYYYSLINSKYKELADQELEKMIYSIANQKKCIFSSYCYGFAGVGVGLHLLEEAGFIEGTKDMLDDLNPILTEALITDIRKNNYDFLHGAIGIGFYYLKHYRYCPQVSLIQINRIIDYLDSHAILDEKSNCCSWIEESVDFENKNRVINRINLSLSHGMSSIIIFLAQLLNMNIEGINVSKVKTLLENASNYMLSQKIDHRTHGSYFCNLALNNTTFINRSRLAWCYGDLGIAVALWQSAFVLKNQKIADFAMEIFNFSINRTEENDTLIHDAGLCHGAAGVGQIFYRMYKETQIEKFLIAHNYWKKVVLSMLCHVDGIGGYKLYNRRDKIWENNSSVLEGSAGVGLFLLSEENPSWDEILLLNFK